MVVHGSHVAIRKSVQERAPLVGVFDELLRSSAGNKVNVPRSLVERIVHLGKLSPGWTQLALSL